MKTTLSLTPQDYGRLRDMLAERGRLPHAASAELQALEDLLDFARVVHVEKLPADIVTMNSRVLYEDVLTGDRTTATLVYPEDANPSEGRISVLSPVGGALLGESEGGAVELPLPHGRTRRIRILSVIYQPESQGDYAL